MGGHPYWACDTCSGVSIVCTGLVEHAQTWLGFSGERIGRNGREYFRPRGLVGPIEFWGLFLETDTLVIKLQFANIQHALHRNEFHGVRITCRHLHSPPGLLFRFQALITLIAGTMTRCALSAACTPIFIQMTSPSACTCASYPQVHSSRFCIHSMFLFCASP